MRSRSSVRPTPRVLFTRNDVVFRARVRRAHSHSLDTCSRSHSHRCELPWNPRTDRQTNKNPVISTCSSRFIDQSCNRADYPLTHPAPRSHTQTLTQTCELIDVYRLTTGMQPSTQPVARSRVVRPPCVRPFPVLIDVFLPSSGPRTDRRSPGPANQPTCIHPFGRNDVNRRSAAVQSADRAATHSFICAHRRVQALWRAYGHSRVRSRRTYDWPGGSNTQTNIRPAPSTCAATQQTDDRVAFTPIDVCNQ
jgi:hypothetical protein